MSTVVGGLTATRITDEEARAGGLNSNIGPNGMDIVPDPDSHLVNMLRQSGLPQTDKEGRPVISYKQYQDLLKSDVRMDGYVLRVYLPGRQGMYLVQASKYLKWYGRGFRPVAERAVQAVRNEETPARRRAQAEEALPEVTIFYCHDKYPDCTRFFDRKKGLETHWRTEHGEMATRRAKAIKAVEPEAEDEPEEE